MFEDFELKLNGEKSHANQIQALGFTNNDQLELKCKWFRIDKQLIEVSQKSHYWPSSSDIGFSLLLQAEPITSQYQGMPKSLEIGPIQENKQILDEAELHISRKRIEFPVKISGQDALLKITQDSFTLQEQSLPIDLVRFSVLHDTHNLVEFTLDKDQTFTVAFSSNIERDIVLLFLKKYQSTDKLLILEKALCHEKECRRFFETKVGDYQNQLMTITNIYQEVLELSEKQKHEINQLNEQKLFLIQDVNMYKGQVLNLEEKIRDLKSDLTTSTRRSSQGIQAQLKYEQLKPILQQKEHFIDELIKEKKDLIANYEERIERLENELNHEKQKYTSLIQEKQNFFDKAENQQESKKESSRLKRQIINLEATIKRQEQWQPIDCSLKIAYEQDIRRGIGMQKKQKEDVQENDVKFMQHLANNLAEVITEKEIQLQNQIDINKKLMQQISRK